MLNWFLAAGLAAGVAAAPQLAHAAEIIILASQGSISGARDMAAAFEKASGHKVIARQEKDVMATVNAGTPADIATLNPPLIDKLIKEGKVVGNRVDFARAGIGVAVKAGAPKPDLSNTEAFVRMLRNAKSIGYSQAGSGLMVANIIKTLGLTEELKARTKFLDGFPAAEAVARGEVEIALAADQRDPAGGGRRARRGDPGGAAAIQSFRRRACWRSRRSAKRRPRC